MAETVAARICDFLRIHGEATRPQLEKTLGIGAKSIETAMRKLIKLEMVRKTERTRLENGPRPAYIYVSGAVEFDQRAFSIGLVRRGRPVRDVSVRRIGDTYELATLMQYIFRPSSESVDRD